MTMPALLASLARCRVYNVGLALAPGIPHGPTQSPFLYSLIKKHGRVVCRDGVNAAAAPVRPLAPVAP